MVPREPLLKPVPIAELRPTQMTLGYREVEEKRRRWRGHDADKRAAFLGQHMIPVLLGPEKRHYVIDHHHLSRALQEEGVESVGVTVVADLHELDEAAFWTVVDHKAWVHPYDANGVRLGFDAIPTRIADLADDPYRSLAGALRRAGGFAKDTTPFSDFLRRSIKARHLADDFGQVLEEALGLARSREAGHLPGWCGPVTG